MYSREVFWPGAPSQTPSSLDRWEYLSLTYYCPQQPEREPPPSRAPGARSPGSTLHRASFAQGILCTGHPHGASSQSILCIPAQHRGSAWSFPGQHVSSNIPACCNLLLRLAQAHVPWPCLPSGAASLPLPSLGAAAPAWGFLCCSF